MFERSQWKVKFNELRPDSDIFVELDEAFTHVMSHGKYILGAEVEQFENEFKEYIGTNYCVGVGSGFDALRIALMYCTKPGDDVIVPSNAPLPVWMAVTDVGANIIPWDPGDAMVMDYIHPKAFTMKTSAVIVVHQYGLAANVEELKIPDGVALIEDCAQAHGAALNGKKVGSFGTFGCWSFYPTKNLGCFGDGGALTTNGSDENVHAREAREYGMGHIHGINSRLDELQAAFLRVKLKRLDEENNVRIERAKRYNKNLYSVRPSLLTCPTPVEGVTDNVFENLRHVYHQYIIKAHRRDYLQQHLREAGIETLVHYKFPPARVNFYSSMSSHNFRDNYADDLSKKVLSLPIANATDSEIDYVCEKIEEFYG